MIRSRAFGALVVALSLGFAGTAAAQSPTLRPVKPKAAAKSPPATVFDFDADAVEGELQRPLGEGIMVAPKPGQPSLIEIRRDFAPEIRKSLEDL